MSFERPANGVLVFQCDACFDTHEFDRHDGYDVGDFRMCWRELHEEGWSLSTKVQGATASGGTTEHLCPDCTEIMKTDRANPFR